MMLPPPIAHNDCTIPVDPFSHYNDYPRPTPVGVPTTHDPLILDVHLPTMNDWPYCWHFLNMDRIAQYPPTIIMLKFIVGVVSWDLNSLVLLGLPVMKMFLLLAQTQYEEHSSLYHSNSKRNCSLCSHYEIKEHRCHANSQISRLELLITMIVILASLKLAAKCSRFCAPILLLLLCGDVETNPGPGKYAL